MFLLLNIVLKQMTLPALLALTPISSNNTPQEIPNTHSTAIDFFIRCLVHEIIMQQRTRNTCAANRPITFDAQKCV